MLNRKKTEKGVKSRCISGKTTNIFLAAFCIATLNCFAQGKDEANTADSTGLPGDHFSLHGALDLFKSSSSLEDFEKKLNIEDNAVNNLDLNGDGDIDYIRVIDNKKDSAHAIVLQVPVNETESQDVAVIELEKNGNQSAIVQIIGDEELYGDNNIVEPFEEKEGVEDTKGKKGPSAPSFMPPIRVVVNVWMWPCVKFVYAPAYVVWVSPWKWHKYPMWWKPWRPHPWRWHHNHCMHYHAFYHPVKTHRVITAHKVYSPHRKTSVVVKNRHKVAHTNYKAKKISAKPNHIKATKLTGKPATKPNMVKNQKPVPKATKGGVKPGGKPGGGTKAGKGGRK